MRVFQEWKAERSKGDLLDNPDIQNLNYWLSRFVTEIRKQDGQPYPPRTIHQILAGLQRRLLVIGQQVPYACMSAYQLNNIRLFLG